MGSMKIEQTELEGRKWSRGDRIAIFALFVAILALGLPYGLRYLQYLQKPMVLITSPSNGAREPNNAFGASGIAKNVPSGSSLWLVVESGDPAMWYPFDRLQISNDEWNITADKICTAIGLQSIEVYLVPNSAAGPLFAYVQNGSRYHLTGINNMPRRAEREAISHVVVANRLLC